MGTWKCSVWVLGKVVWWQLGGTVAELVVEGGAPL